MIKTSRVYRGERNVVAVETADFCTMVVGAEKALCKLVIARELTGSSGPSPGR
jgi:hypothetical protein